MENLDLNNNLENVTTETLPVTESKAKAKMDWKSFGIGVVASILTGGLYTLVVKVIVPKVKAKKAAKNKAEVETVEEQR